MSEKCAKQRLFLRFGLWKEQEGGIAVFPTAWDADQESYVYGPVGPEEEHDASSDNSQLWRKPAYLVRGEEVGHSRAGAVLLRNVRIVGYIMAAYVQPDFSRLYLIPISKRFYRSGLKSAVHEVGALIFWQSSIYYEHTKGVDYEKQETQRGPGGSDEG